MLVKAGETVEGNALRSVEVEIGLGDGDYVVVDGELPVDQALHQAQQVREARSESIQLRGSSGSCLFKFLLDPPNVLEGGTFVETSHLEVNLQLILPQDLGNCGSFLTSQS